MKVYYVKFKDGSELYFNAADQKAADEYGDYRAKLRGSKVKSKPVEMDPKKVKKEWVE